MIVLALAFKSRLKVSIHSRSTAANCIWKLEKLYQEHVTRIIAIKYEISWGFIDPYSGLILLLFINILTLEHIFPTHSIVYLLILIRWVTNTLYASAAAPVPKFRTHVGSSSQNVCPLLLHRHNDSLVFFSITKSSPRDWWFSHRASAWCRQWECIDRSRCPPPSALCTPAWGCDKGHIFARSLQ